MTLTIFLVKVRSRSRVSRVVAIDVLGMIGNLDGLNLILDFEYWSPKLRSEARGGEHQKLFARRQSQNLFVILVSDKVIDSVYLQNVGSSMKYLL